MFSVRNLTRVPYTCCCSLGFFLAVISRGFVCLGKAIGLYSPRLSAARQQLPPPLSPLQLWGKIGIFNALEETSRLVSDARSFLGRVIKALLSVRVAVIGPLRKGHPARFFG